MPSIRNPIIPGFNPDPSIIRVGEDFYIATSSFSYFPGIPIYHSRNLCDWELIGHAFSDPNQIRLNPEFTSFGLTAPTLRYHNGLFYVIVASLSTKETYVVTAENPAGTWSTPHVLPMLPDPDLFWDGDKCYVAAGVINVPGEEEGGITLQELDTNTWRLIGEPRRIWTSAMRDGQAVEAPHLYRIGSWYYLLTSEGGTEHYHAVMVARSRSLFGPYKGYEGNPIFTHRSLSHNYPICNVGHADLVELEDHSWYMVFLGSRLCGGYHKIMGRETFLAPVIWEEEWPVVSPETGKCEWEYPAPQLAEFVVKKYPQVDTFDGPELSPVWNFLGAPVQPVCYIKDHALHIPAAQARMIPECYPDWYVSMDQDERAKSMCSWALGFVGRRQTDLCYHASVELEFTPHGSESAGMVLLQNFQNQLSIELCRKDDKNMVRVLRNRAHVINLENRLHRTVKGEWDILIEREWATNRVVFSIQAEYQMIRFWVGRDREHLELLLDQVDGSFLGSETAGGYVGTYIGMYCSGNGVGSMNEAVFRRFEYGENNVERW